MNLSNSLKQGIVTNLGDDYLLTWIEAFLIDRKAQNLASGTLDFYRKKLKLFADYCEGQAVTKVSQITPTFLREFLIYLEAKGHNEGGIHAVYRSVKTFLRWYEEEVEPESWKNPIRKVKRSIIAIEPLDPCNIDHVQRMIDSCNSTILGKRDKAIFLALLDTGVRATELVNIKLEDVSIVGEVLIRQGKGRKPRLVYLGRKTRKAVRAYLKLRDDSCPYLFATDEGDGLTYWGLRQMVRRRAEQVNVPTPSLHSFRYWFCLTMLRKGTDLVTLSKLMGHADLEVLKRYLKQSGIDLQTAHSQASPVDSL